MPLSKDQVSHGALWSLIVAVLPFLWITFVEPRIVWSDEFRPVKEATKSMQVDLIELRIEGLEEKVSLLHVKGLSRTLTEEEYYRLKSYQDKAEKLKRRLERLGG